MTGWTFDFDVLARIVREELPPPWPHCGALTRRGRACRQEPMMENGRIRNGRCHWHGGKSTGPRTEEGRAAIAASIRRRARGSD